MTADFPSLSRRLRTVEDFLSTQELRVDDLSLRAVAAGMASDGDIQEEQVNVRTDGRPDRYLPLTGSLAGVDHISRPFASATGRGPVYSVFSLVGSSFKFCNLSCFG